MKDLRGTTAIVTGASRGIGVLIARALAEEGASPMKVTAMAVTEAALGPVDILVNNAGIERITRIRSSRSSMRHRVTRQAS